jgi:plastocyanin
MILLEGYDVKSCEGCENLVIEGSNAKFNADEPVTVTFGKVVEVDTSECDHIVTIGADGYSFEPADITIAAGDTVCWMWKDTTDTHNVAEIATKFDADMNLEDAKIGFYSGEAANSVDFRQTFTEDDKTHYYVCEPHATMAMAGTVTVGNGTADDPIQAIVEESGLPSIGFVVGVLTLVGAAGLRRRIR